MPLPTLGVLDKDGAPQVINTLAGARQAAADSSAVALSTEDKAALDLVATKLPATVGSKADAASLATTHSTEDKAAIAELATKQDELIALLTTLVADMAAIKASVDTLEAGQATIHTDLTTDQDFVTTFEPPGEEYETVAASQTAQVMGATGAVGDYISGILVTPATTSPGDVRLLDNALSITVFAGGASSLSNLVPFFIPLGMTSVSGAWKITTGANLSCIIIGDFT